MKMKGVAFLWDESFLWGLMAYKALKGLGLPFELVKTEDIKSGALSKYKMLFVPGGWASNKSRVLGEIGIEKIQEFVTKGGNYLGFCGGAGLATKGKGCLGLLNIKRKPTKERVPSFSGRIYLNVKKHPIWQDLIGENDWSLVTRHPSLIFHAWWPSQFLIEDSSINVLATYGKALPDSFSSDLNVGDVEIRGNWIELEEEYQINLAPKKLLNEPSVIEGNYGNGKVVLSLIHFDTLDDINGQQVLINLWEYLAESKSAELSSSVPYSLKGGDEGGGESISAELFVLCSELISLGERNFLWFWRNSMLLQWRRGVRGLEYNTLYVMIREIVEILRTLNKANGIRGHRNLYYERYGGTRSIDRMIAAIGELLIPFVEKAKRLLLQERYALQKGYITYEKCDDPEVQKLRKELFSDSKSHGGMFKELIDEVDKLLFLLITNN